MSMDLNCWIAMTAAEFSGANALPNKIGWLSCHFSQWGQGLSNLPSHLPPNSLLILDDSTVPHGHDPELITDQLASAVERFSAAGVLLDFQVPDIAESAAITQQLVHRLSCPVCVTAPYAKDLACPVLLPVPPPHVSLKNHLAAWQHRDIWLEIATEAEKITVTAQGSAITNMPYFPPDESYCTDQKLHCRYRVKTFEDRAEFTLIRDRTMVTALLKQALSMGVHCGVGLYQQLG